MLVKNDAIRCLHFTIALVSLTAFVGRHSNDALCAYIKFYFAIHPQIMLKCT